MSQLDLWLGKLEVTNELGEKLAKELQRAEEVAQQLRGGAMALKSGADKVAELGIHVSRDLEEGKLEFESQLKASEYIKRKLTQAREILLNLSEKSKSEELVAHGKAAGLRSFMGTMQNHAKAAKSRTEQLVAQAEELTKKLEEGEGKPPDKDVRIPGEHPGPSALDARREEAALERARTTKDAPKSNGKPATKKRVAKKRVAKKRAAKIGK